MTITDWLKDSSDRLLAEGITSARLDAQVLLAEAVNIDRSQLALVDGNTGLDALALERADQMLQKRLSRTPVSQILSRQEFYGLDFKIDENVMAPRPESEVIVESALQIIKDASQNKRPIASLIDIGTGSGALIISTLKNLQGTGIDQNQNLPLIPGTAIAVDISQGALNIAQQNAKAHGLEHFVEFKRADLADLDLGETLQTPSLILANLPYIPNAYQINAEAQKEPSIALFSGIDGLDHYRILLGKVRQLCAQEGSEQKINHDDKHNNLFILIEHLPAQRDVINGLFASAYIVKEVSPLVSLIEV